MNFFSSLLIVFLLLTSSTAHAVEIPGSDDPALKQAVDAWLQDDDAASLPVFARLANEGNVAARYMLSQIERTTHFSSETEYVKNLERKQRLGLFRAPGGLSGTSWLEFLKEDNEKLATILLSMKTPQYDVKNLATLFELGEHRLAFKELIRHLQFGNYELLEILERENYLYIGEQHYAWYANIINPDTTKERRRKTLKSFNADFKTLGVDSVVMVTRAYRYLTPKTDQLELAGRIGHAVLYPDSMYIKNNNWSPTERNEFHEWLKVKAPATETLTLPYIYCRQRCPEKLGQCMSGVIAMAGGYEGLRDYQSPLENLISNGDYLTSPRALASLSRRMQWQTTQLDLNKRYKISSCLVDELSKK